jgi:intermediate peptidase
VVEIPSHLWEHFATDSRSLALLARHADTRQPMPHAMAQQLARLSTATPALELQQQVTPQQAYANSWIVLNHSSMAL